MIQVRGVRPELHAELVRRAKRRGMTLTDYVEEILEREIAKPSIAEWLEQVAKDEPVELDRPSWEIIREMREAGG